MVTPGTMVALLGASILLWAALEKARAPESTMSMLRQLGLPFGLAEAAALVVLAELTVGIGLVFRPDSLLTQGGVVLVAGAFAIAGLLALRRGVQIRCSCLGSAGHGYLGTRQLVAFVPWTVGAAVLSAASPAPSASEGAAMLACVSLLLAGARLGSILSAWHQARDDRRSARATYVWLQR